MANIAWKDGVNGDFADASDWSTGSVPGSRDNVSISAAGDYKVSSAAPESVRTLKLGQGATLALNGGQFEIDIGVGEGDVLSVASASTISIGQGASLWFRRKTGSAAEVVMDGSIEVASGGVLMSTGAFLSGSGWIYMDGPNSQIEGELGGSVNIEGSGLVQDGGAPGLVLGTSGDILSDVSGQVLELEASDSHGAPGVVSEGTMQAYSGAAILLQTLDGTGFSIEGSGKGVVEAIGANSVVELSGANLLGEKVETSSGGVFETLAAGGGLGGYSLDSLSMEGAENDGAILVADHSKLFISSTIVNAGIINLSSTGDLTKIYLKTEADFVPGYKDTNQTRIVELAGNGSILLSDDSENVIESSSATDILDNEGNTISGAGQIGGGSAIGLINRGVIDATGENALVIDVATGLVTNGAAGVLEGSGASGLYLNGGTYNNIGTVEAMNGSTVTVGSNAVLTNDANGTLTGGAWRVTDTGASATLTLGGVPITTLAATVVLSGTDSFFETGGGSLDASLTAIAAKGKLELLADRDWIETTAVTDAGLLQLGGGGFGATRLTVAPKGEVSGFGTISAPMENDGVVDAYRGAMVVSGDVTGTGTLEVFGGSTLEIGGAVAGSETVAFETGVHAVLKLNAPAAFSNAITNWALGDTIDLSKTSVATARIVGDTLEVGVTGGGVLNYSLANPATNARIVLSSDSVGGTDLTLYKSQGLAVALMAQHIAGFAAPTSAGAVNAETTQQPTPLLAMPAPG